MPVTQTIQFETVSPSEIGSGTITAFLFSDATLAATLASVTENATLKGRHTGTVTDISAATYRLVVKFNGITISESELQVTLLLAPGTYIAVRPAVLDSAVQAQLDIADAIIGGTSTGAGTGTEVFVGRNATVTVTVDSSGNRSAVDVT